MADTKTETAKPKKKVKRTVTVILKSGKGWTAHRLPIKTWRTVLLKVGQGAMTMPEALADNEPTCVAVHDVTEWDAARALAELAKVIP